MEEDIKILEEKIKDGYIFVHCGARISNTIECMLIRLKELEKYYEEQNEVNAKFIPKSKIKEILGRLNISNIEPWSTYKVNGEILFDLQELLEDK